jgi:hypothetical protein
MRIIQRTYLNLPMLFVGILYLINLWKSSKKKDVLLTSTIVLSVFSGLLILNLLEQDMNFRYAFAFFNASLTVLIIYALSAATVTRDMAKKSIMYLAIFLSLALFLHNNLLDFPINAWQRLTSLKKFYKLPHYNLSLTYLNAQLSVPPGELFLEQSSYPYLLNYKRNPIYIVDFLIFGPKPGIPLFQGGEAVAKYLLSLKIRYVLCEHRKADIEKNKQFFEKLKVPGSFHWVQQQRLFTVKFLQDIEELGNSRRKIYDNGTIFVVDLSYKG